jgi:hypothetical protein
VPPPPPLAAPPPPPSTLLLLYAQPLARIAALKTTAIVLTPQELRISLGAEPVPVPEPFAGMLRFHLHNQPNLRITGDSAASHWLFPSTHPGKHVEAKYVMKRLRRFGVNLLAARNSALQNLVAEVPSPRRRSVALCHIAGVAWPRSVDHALNVGG